MEYHRSTVLAKRGPSISGYCTLRSRPFRHNDVGAQHLGTNSSASAQRHLLLELDIKGNVSVLCNQELRPAESTKRDNELMRGITAVTMVFLPAKFVATFFSMVFFHVVDESRVRLTVDRNIWLYPVVTVPLTMFMGAWTFAWSLAWSKSSILRFMGGKRKLGSVGE